MEGQSSEVIATMFWEGYQYMLAVSSGGGAYLKAGWSLKGHDWKLCGLCRGNEWDRLSQER